MVRHIGAQIETPADGLRRRISQTEGLIVNLKGAGRGALEALELLDTIQPQLETLRCQGLDLRSEEARLQALYHTLQRRKKVLLRELKALGGIEKLRAEREPSPEQWWWFLDQAEREERQRAARRYGLMALAFIVVAAGLVVLVSRLFKPDPTVVALFDNANRAMDLVMRGDYQQALPYLEENVALAPQEAEWPIRMGVLQTLLGQQATAETSFEQGRQLSPAEFDFLLQRGQSYIEAGAYERALDDLQRAATLKDQSALTQYLLGQAYAGLGRRGEAMAAFERASELAGKGEEQIHVMARLEAGRLLQAVEPKPALPTGSPTP